MAMTTDFAPISVVIPAHNRAHTIERCLASVLGQTLRPREILVVDDGSVDDTAGAAARFAADSIRVLRLPTCQGAQTARNRAIESSTQEWTAFLDSDDEWLPERLRVQWALLEARGRAADVAVHCDCILQRAGQRTLLELPQVEGPEGYRSVLSQPSPMFQGLLVAKQKLLEIGMLDPEVPSFQEWETAIRLARVADFVHIRQPLFVYHREEGPAVSDGLVRNHAGYEYIIRKHEAEIRSVAGASAWNRHLLRQAGVAVSIGDVAYLRSLPPRFAGSSQQALGALIRLTSIEQTLAATIIRRILRLVARVA
jgi:glycosyltransferase involved in cell wall biosynthesis